MMKQNECSGRVNKVSENEWAKTKEMLRDLEFEPKRGMGGAIPGYQLLINAKFAKALRLIMEALEEINP